MNSRKVIILLYVPHEPNIKQLQETLLSYCKNSNFIVIETIIADNDYDCQVFSK